MKLINKEEVEFNQLEPNKCYKVIFEEGEFENDQEDYKKQSINWGIFNTNDIMVFTMDEILKMKEERACEVLVMQLRIIG